jgi:hypothetical protein
VVADSNLASYSVAGMERFVGNKAGNILANNRFPDEAEEAAGRNNRMDSEDMFGNASDAWVASSLVEGAARIDRAVVEPNRHLNEVTRLKKE